MAPLNSSPVKIVRIIIKYMCLHNDYSQRVLTVYYFLHFKFLNQLLFRLDRLNIT